MQILKGLKKPRSSSQKDYNAYLDEAARLRKPVHKQIALLACGVRSKQNARHLQGVQHRIKISSKEFAKSSVIEERAFERFSTKIIVVRSPQRIKEVNHICGIIFDSRYVIQMKDKEDEFLEASKLHRIFPVTCLINQTNSATAQLVYLNETGQTRRCVLLEHDYLWSLKTAVFEEAERLKNQRNPIIPERIVPQINRMERTKAELVAADLVRRKKIITKIKKEKSLAKQMIKPLSDNNRPAIFVLLGKMEKVQEVYEAEAFGQKGRRKGMFPHSDIVNKYVGGIVKKIRKKNGSFSGLTAHIASDPDIICIAADQILQLRSHVPIPWFTLKHKILSAYSKAYAYDQKKARRPQRPPTDPLALLHFGTEVMKSIRAQKVAALQAISIVDATGRICATGTICRVGTREYKFRDWGVSIDVILPNGQKDPDLVKSKIKKKTHYVSRKRILTETTKIRIDERIKRRKQEVKDIMVRANNQRISDLMAS